MKYYETKYCVSCLTPITAKHEINNKASNTTNG